MAGPKATVVFVFGGSTNLMGGEKEIAGVGKTNGVFTRGQGTETFLALEICVVLPFGVFRSGFGSV